MQRIEVLLNDLSNDDFRELFHTGCEAEKAILKELLEGLRNWYVIVGEVFAIYWLFAGIHRDWILVPRDSLLAAHLEAPIK